MNERWLSGWLMQRQGLTHQDELQEFLEEISLDPQDTQKAWCFLAATYFEGHSLLKHILCCVDEVLYCFDAEVSGAYQEVVTKAKSYFYRPALSYPFEELVALLSREWARSWEDYRVQFVEKALRLSPQFRVRRSCDGRLWIKSA